VLVCWPWIKWCFNGLGKVKIRLKPKICYQTTRKILVYNREEVVISQSKRNSKWFLVLKFPQKYYETKINFISFYLIFDHSGQVKNRLKSNICYKATGLRCLTINYIELLFVLTYFKNIIKCKLMSFYIYCKLVNFFYPLRWYFP